MERSVIFKKFDYVNVDETRDLNEIKEALLLSIDILNNKIKIRIVNEIIEYLKLRFSDRTYKIKVFIAYIKNEICGIVVCQINPSFRSYGKKCGTFGWLYVNSFKICKKLMESCESFVISEKIRKLRGPVNFPKGLGGIGIQTFGFEQKPLYGVPFNNSNSEILEFLEKLNYKRNAEYSCLHIYQKFWDQAKTLDKNVSLRYPTRNELINRKGEIMNIAENVFSQILPDSGCEDKIKELLNIYSQIPNAFYENMSPYNSNEFENIPQIVEALNKFDPYKDILWVGLAYDRKTDDILGVALSIPNLYELWNKNTITYVNADTMMVKKGYDGKGIFSALNALGQANFKRFGINHIEGTSIWSKTTRVMQRIFPHTKLVRKHVVLEKRIRN